MNNDRSDVFRFMAIREPDKLVDVNSARIKAYEEDEDTSVLLTKLNESLQSDTPAKTIEQIATDYVNNKLDGATAYTTSLSNLDPQLSELDKKIHGKSVSGAISFIKEEINRLKITDETLIDWKRRVGDGFNAALVLRKNRDSELRSIEHAIRTLHVVSLVKTDAITNDKEIKGSLAKTITVSKSISAKTSLKELIIIDDENKKRIRENVERAKKAVQEYEDNRAAIKELSDAYDKDWEMRRLQQSEEGASVVKARKIPAVYSGVLQRLGRWLGILPVTEKIDIPESTTPKRQSVLAEEITKNISKKTKDRLTAIGSSPDKIEASFAIMRLEEKNQEITNGLNFSPGGTTALQFGGGAIIGEDSTIVGVHEVPERFILKPGECPFTAGESPIMDDIYPKETGRHHTLNVGELHIIKQKLIGYEIGEIAHIENVMASEERSRNHRTLHRTEEFTSFELEKEEETERDLETTTRFELQKEINSEVQESTEKEAGLTVTGKYGPTVEFTANAGIATEKSSSKSISLSNSYSKEVVDRSVQRIQEKIREKRTLLTIDEVEVINDHKFINHGTEAAPLGELKHINGIYRWVNKKYEAQLFNYGAREIVEVVIPEPAAFIRYLATSHPKEGTTISRPLKPGYCFYGKFIPLSVGTLNETNYLDWVSAYNIQDTEAPPPNFKFVSTTLVSEVETGTGSDTLKQFISSLGDDTVTVPQGYQATGAWISVNLLRHWIWAERVDGTAIVMSGTMGDVTIGKSITSLWTFSVPYDTANTSTYVILEKEEGKLPIAASIISIFPFNSTIKIKCVRTKKALMEWKISTFNTIMNRYEVLKEEYEAAISGEESFGSVDIQGKNPIENKDIILNELKRQVITQMTRQTFDGFDAMREKVPPQGFPQQDVDEAWSEGQYVRFVEQAFEWENMQYLFYPYFWGKKKNWPITSQLEDTDPLFKSFLQAGYCRVNIPIRPGFVNTTNSFLSTGKIPWDSKYDGPVVTEPFLPLVAEPMVMAPVVDEPAATEPLVEEEVDPFLSITEEMKAKQGAVYFKSDGTVSHVDGDLESVLTGNMVEDVDESGEVVFIEGVPVLINGTNFVEDDVDREINIGGKIYMIILVDKEQQKITLDEDIAQSIQGNVQYGIGPKAIGVPWVVTIPTSLVMLHDGDELPEIPE